MALRDGLKPTGRPGVFYKEHDSRKHGARKDRLLVLRYTIEGKTRTEVFGWTSTGATEVDAEKKIAAFKANARADSGPVSMAEEQKAIDAGKKARTEAERIRENAEKNRPTIKRLWQSYTESNPDMKWIGPDSNRFDNYLLPLFGDKTPDQITPLDLDRLRLGVLRGKIGPAKKRKDAEGKVIETREPKSPQTAKHVLVLLRRIIRFAVQRKLCPPPDLAFKMPEVDNQVTEHLTDEQLARLLAALDNEPDKIAVAVVRLALFAGLRKGEMLSLRWQDLDLDRRLLRIVNPKGGKSATVPLSNAAVAVLRTLPTSHDLVFPGRDGKRRSDLKRPLDRIRKAAGLPEGFRPLHGLRHHFASTLASSGEVDLYTLQKLLTHKDPATTQRYAHLRDETMRSASDVAARAITSAIETNKIGAVKDKKVCD